VIEKLLAIPSEMAQGMFRFRCPLCAGRNTGIKLETNLSRCFQCKKNFNAIDLFMLVKHATFVESVTFLIEHKDTLSTGAPQITPASHGSLLEPPRQACKKPVAVSEILANLIGNSFEKKIEDPKRTTLPQESPSTDDIAELEHIVHALSQIIRRLKTATFHDQK
jgi:hypothetical protein